MRTFLPLLFTCLVSFTLSAQSSVARQWNEVLLEAIRNDQARPVVHARNLFHHAAGMYDCWASIEGMATPYFLGRTANGIAFDFDRSELPSYPDPVAAQEEAISYLSYRLLKHRFANSPGREETFELIDELMDELGFDPNITNTDYTQLPAAGLGNYLAEQVIAFGFTDNSNEENDYENRFYRAINGPLRVDGYGISPVEDPNRWQPLAFELFIDQGGNIISGEIPDFLGAEWGKVTPFALSPADLNVYQHADLPGDWYVYHDPGAPPTYEDVEDNEAGFNPYRWNFCLVVKWSSHLDPTDGVMWDISPASIGNIGVENYPTRWEDYPDFYNENQGGDSSPGHDLNPVTGEPYAPNVVPRGDYTRVLAEFWADGPDSETPPGHWFVIMNRVMDHPLFERKFKGEGETLSALEYDIKAYFTLGGAMHDAAITAWGIKGYYDYIRPLSAIRILASQGQRTFELRDFYNQRGIELTNGLIELTEDNDNFFGNIKFNSWRGNRYLEQTGADFAGVDWMDAGWWVPYQRPTFVTPNFAGYVSGHSTYSSAAAEVLELMTGDPYFPGGIGEFVAPANEFLVFEQGPSVDVHLQWATYRDASDQTSLSRIWGGIHPPVDDIPGRLIGIDVGEDAFNLADRLFNGEALCVVRPQSELAPVVSPNLLPRGQMLMYTLDCSEEATNTVAVYDTNGRLLASQELRGNAGSFRTDGWAPGQYYLRVLGAAKGVVTKVQLH